MQTIENLTIFYNEYVEACSEFILIEPFSVNEQKTFFGRIKSVSANSELLITVEIPLNFPYEDVKFTTKSIKGFPHLIPEKDGRYWFCLNTPFVENIDKRLELEFSRLNDWIINFLNQNKKDNHYDYPIIPRIQGTRFYFAEKTETNIEERFKDQNSGEFICYRPIPVDESEEGNVFIDKLGKIDAPWHKDIKNSKIFLKGLWKFIEEEPLKEDGTIINDWEELRERFLEDSFAEKALSELNEKIKKDIESKIENKGTDPETLEKANGVPIALGFKIPSENSSFEVHWEFFSLTLFASRNQIEIFWLQSQNISPKRFFGRGGFCEDFCKQKILLVGLGAIGSNLAEILVRGGVRDLSIADGEIVEPGNICRGNYHFWQVAGLKSRKLALSLTKISPFLNLTILSGYVSSAPHFSDDFESSKDLLGGFDLIFDCTASNELLYFMAALNLKSQIISMGITDEAKNFLCLTNSENDSLYDKRKIVLHSLGENLPPSFYEGTGCYYPTFRASFFDINALLNLALKQINKQIKAKKRVGSFHLSYKENLIEIVDYKVYYQEELGFTLTVFDETERAIENYSRLYYPLEFGGVLTGGYADNGKHIYITGVLSPDKYVNTSVYFKADTKEINKDLKEIYDTSQGNIIYLGDWHSHPNMTNLYSSIDFRSIEEQARSTVVNINNPILSITSISNKGCKIGYYIYYNGNLFEFKKTFV